MIFKNVTFEWAKLTKDNLDLQGRYSIDILLNAEQEKVMRAEMEKAAKSGGFTYETAAWLGTRKEEGEYVRYTAKTKTEFVDKKTGGKVERDLKIYDKHAKRMEVAPHIANGATGCIDLAIFPTRFQKKQGVSIAFNSLQLISYEVSGGRNPYEDVDPVQEYSDEVF